MKLVYFKIALRNLRGRPLRSWLTILGIVIGVFLVVSLLSLSEGLKESVMGELRMMGGEIIMVMPGEMEDMMTTFMGGSELSQADIEAITRAQGVETVVPTAWGSEVIRYGELSKTVIIYGSPWETAAQVYRENLGWSLVEGYWPERDRRQALVGNIVPRDLLPGLKPGDKIRISGRSFEVTGVLRSLGNKQDDSMISLDWPDFQSLFGRQDGSQMVIVKLYQDFPIDQAEENIRIELEKTRRRNRVEDAPAFSIITSDKASDMVGNIMGIIQLAVFFFASIAVLVGGIGIMNTMYTSVYERTKEIGVLKAVGAKKRDIIFIFLAEAGIIGLMGGVVGAALGIGLAWMVGYIIPQGQSMLQIKSSMSILLVFFGLFFSSIVGGLSGYFPARRAANLKPVEALRYE
jgi:putative ABC transport system permease protein